MCETVQCTVYLHGNGVQNECAVRDLFVSCVRLESKISVRSISVILEQQTQSNKPPFHTLPVLRLSSCTVANEMNKKSRIKFVRAEL